MLAHVWSLPRPFILICAIISSLVVGCQQSGPSYADLVVIYNSELEVLDRLEKTREALVSKYEAEMRPEAEDTLSVIGDMLKSAGARAASEIDAEALSDPSRLLDRVTENSEAAQEMLGEAVAALTDDEVSPEEKRRQAELTEKFNQELAALDKEIEEQKARVKRAREARDAAEAKQ